MSMDNLNWLEGSALDRALRRVSLAFRSLRRGRSEQQHTLKLSDFFALESTDGSFLELIVNNEEAFLDKFDARTRSHRVQRKILSASDIAQPLPEEDTGQVLAQVSANNPSQIDLLIIRDGILAEIEAKAIDLGHVQISLKPEAKNSPVFETPGTARRQRSTRLWWLIGGLSLILGIWLCLSTISSRALSNLDTARTQEAALRITALTLAEQDQDGEVLALLERGQAEFQTPQARLELLAEITKGTPQSTWWLKIDVIRDKINIEGITSDRVALLDGLRSKFPDHTVNLTTKPLPEGDDKERIFLVIARQSVNAP